MKKISLSILFLLFVFFAKAQLTVTTGVLTPTQYVQNVLVGNGIAISNVNYYGHPSQIGTFNGATSSLGLDSGLVLSCGLAVETAVTTGNASTNIQTTYGANPNWGGGDPDLLTVAQSVTTNPSAGSINSTNDMAMIEFDFIPTGDSLNFDFVFGSEEYTAWINSFYNDVFGFFISGPGITGPYASPPGFPGGAKNIALVPNTTLPITISTIYNAPGQTPPAFNSQYYIDNPNNVTHEVNGFTTVLTASSEVQCGQLYHIRLAVADCQDGTLDTDVFLQAGSFSSNTVVLSSNVDVGGNDSILYEGCGAASLDFVRTNTADSAVYYYNVTSASTATSADYIISADSVIFLPGQDTVTLSFEAIQDGIVEPLESVTIELVQTICSVLDTSEIVFYIADYPQTFLAAHDTIVECGITDSIPVWVEVTGPDHTISWNTVPPQTTDTIWAYPSTTQQFIVTVTDTCGVYTVVDTADLQIVPPVPIIITTSLDSTKYCIQDDVEIYATASGGGGSFTYNWPLVGSTDSSLIVNPIVTTTYVVEATDLCGTVEIDSVTITVPNFIPLQANIVNMDDTICSGDVILLDGGITGGVDATFSWSHGLGNSSPVLVSPILTTTYILTGQDNCGVVERDTVTLSIVPSDFDIDMPAVIDLDCIEQTILLDVNLIGSTFTETFEWTMGAAPGIISTSPTFSVTPTDTTIYHVVATSNDGCLKDYDSVQVNVQNFDPVVLEINDDFGVHCSGDDVVLTGITTNGSGEPLVINWTDGTNTFVGNNILVNPVVTTTYTAWVNDVCAKDSGATASFTVTVPVYPLLEFTSFSEDTLICFGDDATLVAEVIGGDGDYSFAWSNGLSVPNSITVSPPINRTYNLVVTDGCNLQIDTTVYLTVAAPRANFDFEYQSGLEVQFIDFSHDDIVNYNWVFDNGTSVDQNPLHNFGYDGEHDVLLTVEDIYGCSNTILKTIKPPLLIYSPNSFTPNDDGINDIFKFKGTGIASFKLSIYNRWGELMFESKNIDNGWDGTFKTKRTAVGSYVYKVEAVSYDGVKHKDTGTFHLVK